MFGERAYPLGCSQRDPSYYNYDDYIYPPRDINLVKTTSDYLLVRRLGSGKFSDVFEAVDVALERKLPTTQLNHQVDPRALVVLKCLKPVSERKIRREVLVLSHCSHLPNLARLIGLVIPPSTDNTGPTAIPAMPALVLEHAGVASQWLCHGPSISSSSTTSSSSSYLSEYEIQYYLCHLLVALDALHSCGIMHRDIKPRNVLINRRNLQLAMDLGEPSPLMLIDLGLADFFLPQTRYNVRVASRHYKSPELLIGFEYYDYAIDMWGVGCILAGLLLRKEPFFRGMDNLDQLGKIIGVLGTSDLLNYMTKYKVELTPELRKVVAKYVVRGGKKRSWASLLNESFPMPGEHGLDLLDKLLVYNHEDRLTAKQALEHVFFDPVRDRVKEEVRQRQLATKAKAQSYEQ